MTPNDPRLSVPSGQADLVKVRALYAKLENPFWMDRPQDWIWIRPDGGVAGFGLIACDQPGLANLLWLAMDLGTPPREYDMLRNPAMTLVLVSAAASKLCGQPLVDVAATKTLREFYEMLSLASGTGNPLEQAYPLLKVLAAKRLRHA